MTLIIVADRQSMPFSVSWHTLLEELDDLSDDATLITPLSHDRFRITDVQEQRIVTEFLNRDIDETRPSSKTSSRLCSGILPTSRTS